MADHDPIPDIERLGYTPREAGFLAIVAMHSGYFLRRQFNRYLRKKDGGLAHSFLAKAEANAHVRVLPLSQRRFVFHLHSRTVYRFCGVEESQNRRIKSDRTIKTRLLALDYVLDHPQQHFFRSEPQKIAYFCETLRLPLNKLPGVPLVSATGETRRCLFPDRFPVSVLPGRDGHGSRVSFGFVDDGIETLGPFRRFLLRHELLLRSLSSSEIVYIADSKRNFEEAGRLLARMFPTVPGNQIGSKECPLGVDHFLAYLEAREADEDNEPITDGESLLLDEGDRIYQSQIHEELFRSWVRNEITDDEICARYGAKPIDLLIRGYLITAPFPQNGPKYRGVE